MSTTKIKKLIHTLYRILKINSKTQMQNQKLSIFIRKKGENLCDPGLGKDGLEMTPKR